jgi:HSP20 family protein
MAIIRYPGRFEWYRPFRELEEMRNRMDQLFSEVVGRHPLSGAVAAGVFPSVNVSEAADNVLVRAELPGLSPADVEISVEGNTLTLRGERKRAEAAEAYHHRRERQTGRFQRALTLPDEIDTDKVQAVFADGVLTVTLPKAEKAKPKKIEIKSV